MISREPNHYNSITCSENIQQSSLITAATQKTNTDRGCQVMSKKLKKELKSRSAWWGFGYIQTTTVQTIDPDDPKDGHVKIVYIEKRLCPASWTRLKGFTVCQGLDNGNWKYWFKPGHVIPDSAEIFQACMYGDLDRVISLVSASRASVHDMTEEGWTPLHVRFHDRQCMLKHNIYSITGCCFPSTA